MARVSASLHFETHSGDCCRERVSTGPGDRVNGDTGGDFLYGGPGNDWMHGCQDEDLLEGGAGGVSPPQDRTGDPERAR